MKFCHVIHSINQVPKRPTPLLEKGSAIESKACVFNILVFETSFTLNVIYCDTIKGAVSRNSAKLRNYKMSVKLRET